MSYDTNCPWWGQTSEGVSLACQGQCTCGKAATSQVRQRKEHVALSARTKSKFHTNPTEPR